MGIFPDTLDILGSLSGTPAFINQCRALLHSPKQSAAEPQLAFFVFRSPRHECAVVWCSFSGSWQLIWSDRVRDPTAGTIFRHADPLSELNQWIRRVYAEEGGQYIHIMYMCMCVYIYMLYIHSHSQISSLASFNWTQGVSHFNVWLWLSKRARSTVIFHSFIIQLIHGPTLWLCDGQVPPPPPSPLCVRHTSSIHHVSAVWTEHVPAATLPLILTAHVCANLATLLNARRVLKAAAGRWAKAPPPPCGGEAGCRVEVTRARWGWKHRWLGRGGRGRGVEWAGSGTCSLFWRSGRSCASLISMATVSAPTSFPAGAFLSLWRRWIKERKAKEAVDGRWERRLLTPVLCQLPLWQKKNFSFSSPQISMDTCLTV